MLISWKHRFVLLHIPKTGGTSLTAELARYARVQDRFVYTARATPLVSSATSVLFGGEAFIKKFTGFTAHATMAHLERAFPPEMIEPLRIVCFARNPYTRMLSLYRHIVRAKGHGPYGELADLSFPEAVRRICDRNWEHQSSYVRRADGGFATPFFTGSFERLEEDVAAMMRNLSLPPLTRLPHRNAARRGADRQEEIVRLFEPVADRVAEVYRGDFERFGYSRDPADALMPPTAPARAQNAAAPGGAP